MYRLHGYFSQNSMKTLYVLQEVAPDFEFSFVNLAKREQLTEAFRSKTPVGKAPVLEHAGRFLFESGAICRYVAANEGSALYPAEPWQRAQVEQWLDFFTCHLGSNLSTLFFQLLVKPRLGLGDPDQARCEEARVFARQQFGIVDRHLAQHGHLANDRLSIADLAALAYVEQVRMVDFSLDEYPAVRAWFAALEARPSVAQARSLVAPYLKAAAA